MAKVYEMSSRFQMTPLCEVLEQYKKYIESPEEKTYKKLSVKLYGRGVVLDAPTDGATLKMRRHQIARSGQVILSEIWGKKGAIGLVPPEGDGALCTSHFFLFNVKPERIDPNYLQAIFVANFLQPQLEKQAGGTTGYAAVRPHDLLSAQIPLPSLQEQKRLVVRIESLLTRIQIARELSRQADEDERVLTAVERAKTFRKIQAGSCRAMKLDEVAPINMGQSPPGHSYNEFGDGIPLLNGPTEFGKRYPTAVQWTTAPTKLCKKGDILICVRGATTGKMNWADKEYCIGRGLAALTPRPEYCLPEYIYHFIETQTQQMFALTAGSTFPNLPGAKLKRLDIPVPSLTKQQQVVEYLGSLHSKMEELEGLHSATAKEIDELIPNVLDRAFRGEL